MPPNVSTVTPPTGRGEDLLQWLEYHGLQTRVPTIRSSDEGLYANDPYGYWLTRRLGLVPALRWSKALSRGSWFHKRLELIGTNSIEAAAIMNGLWDARVAELEAICRSTGRVGDQKDMVIQRERKDFMYAQGMYEACRLLPLRPAYDFGFEDYFAQSHWRLLGCEQRFVHKAKSRIVRVAHVDQVYYHEGQNTVWLLDGKTHDGTPLERAEMCPLEYQTNHYLDVAQSLIDEGVVQEHFGLPADVRLGGMFHLICQKPKLEFGQLDRTFTETTRPLKSGPRKGQMIVEREYTGEPTLENYARRCARWLRGEGEYVEHAMERAQTPPVVLSRTIWSSVTEDIHEEYRRRSIPVHEAATMSPVPSLFPRRAEAAKHFGGMSELWPLYRCEPAKFVDVVHELQLLQVDRDSDIDVATIDSCIMETLHV